MKPHIHFEPRHPPYIRNQNRDLNYLQHITRSFIICVNINLPLKSTISGLFCQSKVFNTSTAFGHFAKFSDYCLLEAYSTSSMKSHNLACFFFNKKQTLVFNLKTVLSYFTIFCNCQISVRDTFTTILTSSFSSSYSRTIT